MWSVTPLEHLLGFVFLELLRHLYESLSADSSSIRQESSSGEGTLLSMGRVVAVHEKVAWEVLANSTMLNSALRTSIQSTLAPERLAAMISTSRTAGLVFSIKKLAYPTVRATRRDKVRVHSANAKHRQPRTRQ